MRYAVVMKSSTKKNKENLEMRGKEIAMKDLMNVLSKANIWLGFQMLFLFLWVSDK